MNFSKSVKNLKLNKKYTYKNFGKSKNIDLNKNIKLEPVFAWPIKKSKFRISSRFGPRKKPDGSWGFHHGIDLAACRGTYVYAPASGVVLEAGYCGGFGNAVVIAHNKKFKTRYAHLSVISVNIGQHVSVGEVVGKVGSTGNVRTARRGGDPSHLHFEVIVFGKKLNPLYYLV